MGKYSRPEFLPPTITTEQYERWLSRKAVAHCRRDQNRGNITATPSEYKAAIHKAVIASNGVDAYTGEILDWSLISQYRNEDSKASGRQYRKQFCLLPTVDHVGDGLGAADFRICSWRTNDAKNDLSLEEFLALCKAVLQHNGFLVQSGPEFQDDALPTPS